MSSDMEYLLLKDKGPYHEVYVRRRLNTNPGTCKFYTIVITVITVSLLLLLLSLVYVFVLVPSWHGTVLSWDGRPEQEARMHVLTHTECGLVEGLAEKGVYVFKGIPYAMPPVGSQRWREPGKMVYERGTCWRGIFQAKTFGSSCVQPRDFSHSSTAVYGDEDCLFLNVWTQSLDPLANRPVMVWIHGGDFLRGSGHAPPMSPTPEVTKSTHAVYVSFNYRLGPFGFLTLEALSRNSTSGTSGNYGLMDTIQALEWVRDNIKNFGGNPDKVTVFGQGSGATLIQALLASSIPRSSGLFHRAWLASASPILNKTSTQASRQNIGLLNLTGCSNAACLRRLSAQDVLKGTAWWKSPMTWLGVPVHGRRDEGFALSVLLDGHILKEAPLQAWNHDRGYDVPTVFTTTAQEADLLPFDPTISSWSWQHYKATVMQQLSPYSPDLAHRALERYPPDSTLTPEYQYTTLVTDLRLTCHVHELARVSSGKFRSPVYRAVVVASPSSPVNLLNVSAARYAFRGWDLLAFFGDFQAFGFRPAEEDRQFQAVMRRQMLAFARDGRPEAPVWDTAPMSSALLSDHVFPVEHYGKRRCELWSEFGFLSYPSVN